jgi:hypothetical protein
LKESPWGYQVEAIVGADRHGMTRAGVSVVRNTHVEDICGRGGQGGPKRSCENWVCVV